MKIFINELYRVFSNKIILFSLVLLACFNLFYLINDNSYIYSVDTVSYNALYEEIANLSDEEKLDSLGKEIETLENSYNFLIKDIALNEDGCELELFEVLNELEIKKIVYDEINLAVNYHDFIDSINSKAEEMKEISIFSDPNSFQFKLLEKSPKAYENLKDTKLKMDNPFGETKALTNLISNITLILAAILVSVFLFCDDIEKGTSKLISSTKNGRKVLLINRFFVLLAISFLVSLVIFSANIAVNFCKYGFGDVTRPLQSLPFFFSSVLSVSVFEYMIIDFFAKILLMFLASLITVLLCRLLQNSLIVYVCSTLFLSLQAFFYYCISANFWLNAFKYFNTFSIVNLHSILSDYLCINFFENAISLNLSLLLFFIVSLIVLITLLLILPYNIPEIKLKLFAIKNKHQSRFNLSIFCHESYKLIVTAKSGLVFLAAIFFALVSFFSYNEQIEQDDKIYRSYINAVSGEIGDKTFDFIEGKDKEYVEIENTLSLLNAKFEQGELDKASYNFTFSAINQKLSKKYIFDNFVLEVNTLKASNQSIILYKTGYEKIIGSEAFKNNFSLSVLGVFFLCLSLSQIYTMDNKTGMSKIINTTKKGRKKLLTIKIFIAFICASFITLTSFLPYIINTLKLFGAEQITAKVNLLFNFPLDISILVYILLLTLLRISLFSAVAIGITFISKHSKNLISAVCLSVLIFVLPLGSIYFLV